MMHRSKKHTRTKAATAVETTLGTDDFSLGASSSFLQRHDILDELCHVSARGLFGWRIGRCWWILRYVERAKEIG
jgi:hypothetical protein